MFDSVRRAAALAVVFAVLVPSPAPAAGDKDEKRDDPVVAIVNGAPIQRSDVEEARGRLPARMRQLPLQAVFDLLLDSLINTKLVAGQAREQGLHEEEKIKRQMARIEDQILERAFLVRYIKERVTEDAMQERYEKLVAETKDKEEISARHILVETEGEASEIIADLKKGEDFAELAKKRSTGPSASAGGDLGFFSADRMDPEFAKAAFALDTGQFTETPVKTQFGWHVIKVEDRRAATPPTVEEVTETLRTDLTREIGTAYIRGLREKADVQRVNPDGAPVKDGGKAQAPK
ncbi:MAG: peptidylprolyl isomerase [Kiloniellales bacterium]